MPDIASQYFGQSLTSRQVQELAKDVEIGYRTEAKDMRQLQKKRPIDWLRLHLICGLC